MTIVGKILVFVNLVFSLLLGFLVILVYSADKRAERLVVALEDKVRILDSDNATLRAESKTRKEKDQEFQKKTQDLVGDKVAAPNESIEETRSKLLSRIEGLRYAETAKNEQILRLQTDLAAERKITADHDSRLAAAQIEVDRRQKDVEQMREALTGEVKKTTRYLADKVKAEQDRTQAELTARTATELSQRLERQVEQLARDNARLTANVGRPAGAGSLDRNAKNPPPADIEGLVLVADERSDLYKLSVGSDSGLEKGQTLEVFRLSKVPGQSKYLGTLRVTEVGAKEAVGQPMGKMTDRLRPGDWVASRINKN